jgi:hypothetical protein
MVMMIVSVIVPVSVVGVGLFGGSSHSR